jgi:RNA polymerase sigma factor (TIGR02999 family)
MSTEGSHVFTALLGELKGGRKDAADEMVALVYHELRKLAEHYMQGERKDHTLQATALVNEVYMDLFGQPNETLVFENKQHFIAIAAKRMRRILVDHARKHNAQMRGGGDAKISIEDAGDRGVLRDRELTALDDALTALEHRSQRACQVVELCFFGGLTQQETADVLDISLATVQRDWELAKAFLYEQLRPR